MSAPLVVNTADGMCWTRREATRDGQALYALEAVRECPEHLMETYAELEARGIAGVADVLPVPVGPEPQADPLAVGRGLDLLALMDERAASVVSPVLAAVLDEAERLRARIAELEALVAAASEFRVWEPGYGLYIRRAPGASGFAILEARRTSQGRRVWTTSGLRYTVALSDEELFCWPDAGSAVAEARRVLPGGVVREDVPVEEAARPASLFSTVAGLREDPHDSPLHHTYLVSRDLPETGSTK